MTGAVLSLGACGDIGNETFVPPERVVVNDEDLNNVPWCVGSCLPDYGSQRIDCAAEAGLEFFPFDVLNPTAAGVVTGFYAYNDNTNDFMVSGPDGYDPNAPIANFEPTSVQVTDRCGPNGEAAEEWVHHIRGGLFREWGGGIGRRLTAFATDCAYPDPGTNPEHCVEPDERVESVADLPGEGRDTLRNDFYTMMVDLRAWDGISFWARGGPNNTAGIRVALGDRQLDDDIAFLEARAGLEPLCERVRECGCRNHRPCTANDLPEGGFSCWDPAIDAPPSSFVRPDRPATIYEDWPYETCGITSCNGGNPAFAAGMLGTNASDPLFRTAEHPAAPGTAQCLPFKLTNDLEDYFCYTPGDPKSEPADSPDRCGDVWAKGVTLTTDWRFYKVPFSELRQEGYAKLFGNLDLSKITLVRFTWMQGWIDVWLDDVRFYREIRQ